MDQLQEDSTITRERFDAVLFDLDGVLTDTTRVHAACWKKMFDEFLRNRAESRGDTLLHILALRWRRTGAAASQSSANAPTRER